MADIYGKNPVLEILKSEKSVNKLLIAKGIQKGSIQEIVSLAKSRQIPIQYVEKGILNTMFSGKNHQGVVAQVATAQYVAWQDILQKARDIGEDPLIIVLDEIEDPHNLGAILRTADAAGAHGVIIPKRRAVPLTEGVAKASAGAVEHVLVARVANLAQTLENLKEEGCWVVGTSLEGELIYNQDLRGALAVVIGNEGKGLGRLVSEKCDLLVRLPMNGKINSLNASVAAGVVMYEIMRQRTNI